jgi:hypothetical protein
MGTFLLISEIGLFLVVLESFFTIQYVNANSDKPKHISNYTFKHHAFNHLLYPFVYYVGFVAFIAFEENTLLSMILGFIGFLLYFAHFYYLPRHIRYDHIDHSHSKNISAKVDFTMYLFKFVSFFIVNLALFQGHAQSRLSMNVIFIVNLVLMSIYFYFHINRIDKVTFINLFMAVTFSLCASLAIVYAKTSIVNFSAAIATLLFYLTSGIYYHKIDGTLDYKVLIEYSSIAILVSVFLFSM